MIRLFITLLLGCVAINSFGHLRDSFTVYFPLNKSELTIAEQQQIDSLIYNDYIFPSLKLAVLGFTDYLASDEYNMQLSQQRAENVKAYLEKAGFSADNIILCIGKGKIPGDTDSGKTGNSEDRKVIIAIKRDSANATPPATAKVSPKIRSLDNYESLRVNETLVLENIYFLPGKHVLKTESMPELEKLAGIMKAHPKFKIRIEGHACCVTSGDGYDLETKTYDVSTRRAKVIYDGLIERGISKGQLEYVGLARTHPLIDPERTIEDSNKNRRVEIRILRK
jgi:outer membrane protein OmpA-like peptidoglycan-associated protein